MSKLPFEDIRIADFTRIWAGPLCTAILADMGAEVIKIEPPWGDVLRGRTQDSDAGIFNQINRNKSSVIINITKPKGVALTKELIKISDIVIDNYGYGVMNRVGLDYQTLKQVKRDLIMLSMPSMGNSGPWKDFHGYGVTLEPLMGLLSITGYPNRGPMRSGVDHVDGITGVHAAGALMAALLHRQRTGQGQFIDLSHLESAVCLIGDVVMAYTMNKSLATPQGNHHSSMAPHGCYRCKGDDDWVAISVSSDEEWETFCNVLGNPLWSAGNKFSDLLGRWNNQEELNRYIEEWTQQREQYDVMHLMQEAGIAAGAVLSTRALISDPHLGERHFFEDVTHPDVGARRHMGPPYKMSKTSLKIRKAAPGLGEHNDYVFGQLLGLTKEKLADLENESIISR